MYLAPNKVFILDAGLVVDHAKKPNIKLMSDDGSQSIGSDDFLWYIARDPNGVSAFFEQHSLDLDTVNKIVLAIIKLDSRHFDKAGKLQLNYENRPYGYNLSDFSQTLPGSFIRQVKQSIEQAFGKASQ